MSKTLRNGASLSVGAVLLFGSICLLSMPSTMEGQEKKDGSDTHPVAGSLGIDLCVGCHKGGNPVFLFDSTSMYTTKEYKFWKEHDLHAYAFESLSKPLGQRMQQNLSMGSKDYKVTEDKRCLSCHAVDYYSNVDDPKSPFFKPFESKTAADYYTKHGMSCEACHGFSDKWMDPHWKPNWRSKTEAEKNAFNLIDVRNPVTRTKVCADCHVGNQAKGMIVTHDIYAAGHPPLPPIEVVTFGINEPSHWVVPNEKDFRNTLALGKVNPADFGTITAGATAKLDQTQMAWQRFYTRPVSQESKVLRELVITSLVTFQCAMKLIGDEAGKAAKESMAMDFTHFDCYACHHDLKYPSERQARGYDGPPGRVPAKPYPTDFIKVIVSSLPLDKNRLSEFNTKLAALNTAYKAGPFGDPAKIKAATDDLYKWTQDVLSELNTLMNGTTPLLFDAPIGEKLFNGVLAIIDEKRKTGYIDYESAQHLLWVAGVIGGGPIGSAESGYGKGPRSADMAKVIEKLAPGKSDLSVAPELGNPKLLVRLRPLFFVDDKKDGDEIKPKYVSVEARVNDRLKILNNFKSKDFFDAFALIK